MIAEMMREGSPFDEPVPAIGFDGTSFAFTGKFSSGTRSECQEAVENCGAIGQKSVNRSTDFLIIGSEGSDNWAEGSHGRKIEKAMMFRMDTGKPVIVSESDWLTAIQTEKSERIESRKNTNTNSSIELLAELTSSARMNRRSKHLLRDAKDPSNAGWYMHVPTAFNDALDIKFESSGPNMGWTQSGCFAFKQADTLYDTEKAYQKWAEALKEIGMSLVITTASASGVGDGKTRYAGSVTFQVLLPTVNRTRLVEVFDWTMSQDAFVRFLIEGPSGDFEMALAQARNSIAS
jgi:ribosomal protein S11